MFTTRVARQDGLAAIAELHDNGTVPSRRVTADTEPASAASRRAWSGAHLPRAVLHDGAGLDFLIPGRRLQAD